MGSFGSVLRLPTLQQEYSITIYTDEGTDGIGTYLTNTKTGGDHSRVHFDLSSQGTEFDLYNQVSGDLMSLALIKPSLARIRAGWRILNTDLKLTVQDDGGITRDMYVGRVLRPWDETNSFLDNSVHDDDPWQPGVDPVTAPRNPWAFLSPIVEHNLVSQENDSVSVTVIGYPNESVLTLPMTDSMQAWVRDSQKRNGVAVIMDTAS